MNLKTPENTTILVCGGAGYIGSHTVYALWKQGYQVLVLDNLSYGHIQAIPSPDIALFEGDIGDQELVDTIFQMYQVDAVIHFAAFTYVGESVQNPVKYYKNNLISTLNLLERMLFHGCLHFVFSSTCAIYGLPQQEYLTESHPQAPISPYGKTKWMIEHLLQDYEKAYSLRFVALRYFNASGASKDGNLGEDHQPESHLIPLALQSLQEGSPPLTVFGKDYDTPDGTCIRDYIHVEDLASAHILALEHLLKGGASAAYNIGSGQGFSVLEILQKIEQITGKAVPYHLGERRAGDPPRLVADSRKAQKELGWKPCSSDLDTIIASAWEWARHGGRFLSP
jgi:UDP-glucose-4-epimerase GalE